MSWLKDLLGKEIRTLIDGVESILPMRKTLRIVGSSAISAEDNPTAGTTDLYIAPSGSLSDVLSTGNDAGGKTIENLDEPLNDTDAATKGYVDNAVAVHDLSAVLEAGNDAGGKTIENLDEPFNSTDAATKGYVDNAVADISDIDGSKIKELSLFTDRLLRVGNLVSTNRELELSDLGCTLINISVAPRTLTIPFSDDFPDGAFFRVYQLDEDGRFTIEAGSGVGLIGATERSTYRPGDYITLTKLPGAAFGEGTWFVEANCSESGTYEPIISNTEHFNVSTARGWWVRTGRIVSAEVSIVGTNNSATAPKHVEISLPLQRILSGDFPASVQVGGSASWGAASTASIYPAVLRSVNGTQRVYINAADTDGSGSRIAQATFTYEL